MNYIRHMVVLVLALISTAVWGQTVSGTVTDENNQPLPGATVVVQGTNRGTSTDFDGKYQINAAQGETLVFSYVGYATQEIIAKGGGNSLTINALLQPNTKLDEVVVTAYGKTQSKESLTGAVDVVGAETLEKRNLANPISSLEGNVTGLQTYSGSGQPGAGPDLVIRGVGTLNGETDPLIIVDGVQFEGSINSINQDDIESISVLKGAASTSLYGSRAANGVVLIVTKKGRNITDGIDVNVTSQYSIINKAIPEYDAVNPGHYYELMWEAYKNSLSGSDAAAKASANIYDRLGYNPFNVANDQIVGTDGKLNPNASVVYESLSWYDLLERTGERTNHSISLTSGSEKSSIYFSASNLKETGYIIESSFERTTGRLNANFTPNDWLSVGGSLNLALNKTVGLGGVGSSSIVNPFSWAKDIGSIYPVYLVDSNGKIARDVTGKPIYDYGEGNSDYNIQSRPYNPGRHGIAEAYFNDEVTLTNNYGLRYYADFNLYKGLTFSLNYGKDYQDYIDKEYENQIVGDGAPTGRYGETRYRRTVENFIQRLNYDISLNDSHNFALMLGHESFDRNYSEIEGLSNTQIVSGIYEFRNFTVPTNLDGFSTDKRTEGYFARLDYDYNQKYYLTVSGRRDGSSVFSAESRWGNFYAVGASWSIDKEKFMKNVDFIDRLKIRASFGEVGNDQLNDFYIYQPRYSLTSNAGDPGLLWTKLGNYGLAWETVTSSDYALEFVLFDNVISGSFEYYKKNSSKLLYDQPIAPSNGLTVKPDNIGDMTNSGFEVSIDAKVINNTNFKWDLRTQFSTLKNEITSLPSPFVDGSKRWAEGHSRYDYFIYHYAGVDPSNGDALYYMFVDDNDGNRIPKLDADGKHETTNKWSDAGKAYSGDSALPKLLGSIRNQFSYKNFALDFLVTFSRGGKILDYGYANMMHTGNYGRSYHPDALNAWRKDGDTTSVPRLEVGNTNQVRSMSTRFLTDASFVALRNVNLSYQFEEGVVEKLGFDNMSLFLSGENLFISSARRGLDPQYNLAGTPEGNDYNPSRILSLGLKLNF